MWKTSKYRKLFIKGSKNSVRIMAVIELQRFELWKAKYESDKYKSIKISL